MFRIHAKLSLLLLALSQMGLIAASPTAKTPKVISKGFTDTFEDKPTQANLGQNAAVGTEGDLMYPGFEVATAFGLENSVFGVIPASQRNTAVNAAGTIGAPNVGITTSGTAVKYFDLTSFFFGCGTNDGGATSVEGGMNVGCCIEARGFGTNGQQVASEPFCFGPTVGISDPNAALAYPMAKAVLPAYPSFLKLANVTFGIASSATTPLLTILVLDNVTHVNYY